MSSKDQYKPKGRVVMTDFPGYTPNVDPHDIPPGVSTIQINAVSIKPGELRVRPGFSCVQFDIQTQ